MPESLAVAEIIGVHGVRGWVKIRPLVEDPVSLAGFAWLDLQPAKGTRLGGGASRIKVTAVRQQGKGVIAQLAGVTDRDGAEALRGCRLMISSDRLPPAGAGNYYWRELVGLAVWCRDPTLLDEETSQANAVLIGRVGYLLETGANDVLVVKPTPDSIDERERLLPWLPDDVIVSVDLDAGAIQTEWPLNV